MSDPLTQSGLQAPTLHNLKTWPEYFQPVLDGTKRFEIRINDRNYKAGDTLNLQEYEPSKGEYTGRELDATVTYVLQWCQPNGMLGKNVAVLSIDSVVEQM